MLVLSRKEGEKLVIGDNITLVVSKISGNRVSLGIEAPADVKIFRGELSEEKTAAKDMIPMRRAATVTIDLDEIAEAQARNFGAGEHVHEELAHFAVDVG
ncbi:MAG: carbon storage regulator [bacterium]|nr:carbon storage regulator [bacterium]